MNIDLIISILLTLMYFLSGIDKISNISTVSKGLNKKLPFLTYNLAYLAIILVILLEIIAPIIIVHSTYTNTNKQWAYYSTIALIIFTILATLLYHFPPFGSTYYPFISNVTVMGGLLLLSQQYKLN